ncbi:unnamed protein product [Periconia digitata]|uniref:C2H2-type domain-containing protein n=1 Tax=Periconia digitata TaxID=1303443 RepID=A0A9W4U3A0_9PLEO|nr:unnamed protein product [Periconia digitata]
MESPNSDLSDYASDDFPDEVKSRRFIEHTPEHEPSARPSKRLRLHNRAPSSPPPSAIIPPLEDPGDLSEDTDGSVPASPHHPGMSAEDDFGQDQVTVCKWEGCEVGDLDNMDNLVEHLHEDHIGTRQKKYSCEWSDCNRKGIPHASGYALRAHMRSHTREKPFYCTLPECDRSFTRSDALAKHMRTVHETEALRPSDPVPKHHSSNPSNKFQRIKLVLSDTKRAAEGKGSTPPSPVAPVPPPVSQNIAADSEYTHNNITYVQDATIPNAPTMVQFPPDISFSPDELSLPAPELFKLLHRQLLWATQESEQLRVEVEIAEKKRRDEWIAKELLVENVMEAEIAKAQRMRLEQGLTDDPQHLQYLARDADPSTQLSVEPSREGKVPWWREEDWGQRFAVGIKTPKEEPTEPQPDDAVATAET